MIVVVTTVAIIKIVNTVSGTAAATSADHIVAVVIVKYVTATATANYAATTRTRSAVTANALTLALEERRSVAGMKLHMFIMSVTLTKLVAAMATAATRKNARTATLLPVPAKSVTATLVKSAATMAHAQFRAK
jgi:hypothetical protein